MSDLLELELADGSSVLVEVEGRGSGPLTRGGRPSDTIAETARSFEQVLDGLRPTVAAIVGQVRAAVEWPGEVEVEFGVKLSTDANLIIARTGGEATLRIALKWSNTTS